MQEPVCAEPGRGLHGLQGTEEGLLLALVPVLHRCHIARAVRHRWEMRVSGG